jgi:hypothetical protein
MGRKERLGSPEGMRADIPSRHTMRAGSLGALALLLTCFAVAIGNDTPSLTVTNRTSHVITVVIADQTFPALAPGARATYQSSGPDTVSVHVSYAPGQGVEGSAQRSFRLVPNHPGTASGTTVYWACAMNSTTTSPLRGGPVTWDVTEETIAVR